MHRSILASLVFTVASGTAAAQVFVIGGGFAADCFEQAKSGNYQFRSADDTCTRALREETLTRSNRAATYVNRGVIRMRDGRYDESLSDYSSAVELQPELGAAYLNEGAAHIYKKDYQSALSPLNRAIELETSDIFAAYYNRAIARENTGDVPGAYFDFKRSLELKPEWELAERQLGRFEVDQPQ